MQINLSNFREEYLAFQQDKKLFGGELLKKLERTWWLPDI